MMAFTALACFVSGTGLLVGGVSALAQATRPPAAGSLFVSLGSMTGGIAILALCFAVVSHG